MSKGSIWVMTSPAGRLSIACSNSGDTKRTERVGVFRFMFDLHMSNTFFDYFVTLLVFLLSIGVNGYLSGRESALTASVYSRFNESIQTRIGQSGGMRAV